jgi:hypothetical protein
MEGMMMNNPPPFAPYPPQPVVKPERGGFLTFVLVVRFIGDGLAILGSLGLMSVMSNAAENGARLGAQGRQLGNLVTIMLVSACLDLAGVAGVLSWKKWGVYLLGACEAVSLILRVQSGQTGMAMMGFLTLCFAAFGIAMRWRYFD